MNPRDPAQLCLRILDHLTDAVLLFEPDCCLAYINLAGEMLFQVSARQVMGLRASEMFGLCVWCAVVWILQVLKIVSNHVLNTVLSVLRMLRSN